MIAECSKLSSLSLVDRLRTKASLISNLDIISAFFFSWLLIKYLCLVEKVLEPTEEAKVEMQPDKDEPSEEAQESIPEEVTIEKGKF